MASVKGTLGAKHLAEEAKHRQKEEEEKLEETKSEEEEEDDDDDEEDGEKENQQEEENLEEEEESDGTEAAKSEDEEKGAEKKAKKRGARKIQLSPVTPSSSLRPNRERKAVDRFLATSTPKASATKQLSIQQGRGVQLKDIPNVAYKLSKRKPDENLQILHSILYGKKTKAYHLKKNIGQFSGYVWVENEHEKQRGRIQDKFDKCVKEKLLDFCDVLNLPVKSVTKKEEICLRLLEFLESPHATTDRLLADKEKKSKKRKSKATKLKRSRTAPGKEDIVQVGEKRKLSSESNEEADNTGDESQEDDQHDEDAEEESVPEGTESEDMEQEEAEKPEEEQNEKISPKKDSGIKTGDKVDGKDTPVKSSKSSKVVRAKRQKVEKDNGKDNNKSVKEKASSKKLSEKNGKPRNVKANLEPSKEELYSAAVNILKNVDFDKSTLSDIIRQLGSHFGVDLMHKKAEVKAIVTDAINNMSDDEGEAGDEENED